MYSLNYLFTFDVYKGSAYTPLQFEITNQIISKSFQKPISFTKSHRKTTAICISDSFYNRYHLHFFVHHIDMCQLSIAAKGHKEDYLI